MKKRLALVTMLVLLVSSLLGGATTAFAEEPEEELYSMVVFSKGSEYFQLDVCRVLCSGRRYR